MSTVTYQSNPKTSADDHPPMAIVSGENIYIVHPTGAVSAIEKTFTDSLEVKQLLANCDFWGDLATF